MTAIDATSYLQGVWGVQRPQPGLLGARWPLTVIFSLAKALPAVRKNRPNATLDNPWDRVMDEALDTLSEEWGVEL